MEWLSRASNAELLAVDTETTGLGVRDGTDYAVGLSISYKAKVGYQSIYIPFRHLDGFNHGDVVLHDTKLLIENANAIVFHNAKFDLVSLKTLGIDYQGPFFDTMIMAHLINENWPRSKSLDSLVKFYIDKSLGKVKSEKFDLFTKTFGWKYVPSEMMYEYAVGDAHLTLMLLEKLLPLYKNEATEELWEHKQKFVRVINKMEARGVLVDVPKVEGLIEQADERIDELYKELGFNANSSRQKEEFFINELGLPILAYTDNGAPSFNKSVMPMYEQMMEERFPGDTRVQKILEYMGWVHSRGLFYRPWIEHLSPDGRLRPNYRLHKDEEGGTTTGRLSCQQPNLQQIPRVTNKEWNKEVKTSLKAKEGYVLLEADYSQLELRLATAYADETSLKQVFNEGRDIFQEMAYQMKLSRDDTKTFVYSTQYGAGVRRISQALNLSTSEARAVREGYFLRYPGFAKFSEDCAAAVYRNKRVRIWTGRHRHFRNPDEDAHKAMNAVIQGGAADIVERIMVKCDETFVDEENCRMLLQVHDSLIFEVKKERTMHYAEIIKETMESVNSILDFGVHFAVDIHYFGGEHVL